MRSTHYKSMRTCHRDQIIRARRGSIQIPFLASIGSSQLLPSSSSHHDVMPLSVLFQTVDTRRGGWSRAGQRGKAELKSPAPLPGLQEFGAKDWLSLTEAGLCKDEMGGWFEEGGAKGRNPVYFRGTVSHLLQNEEKRETLAVT